MDWQVAQQGGRALDKLILPLAVFQDNKASWLFQAQQGLKTATEAVEAEVEAKEGANDVAPGIGPGAHAEIVWSFLLRALSAPGMMGPTAGGGRASVSVAQLANDFHDAHGYPLRYDGHDSLVAMLCAACCHVSDSTGHEGESVFGEGGWVGGREEGGREEGVGGFCRTTICTCTTVLVEEAICVLLEVLRMGTEKGKEQHGYALLRESGSRFSMRRSYNFLACLLYKLFELNLYTCRRTLRNWAV